MLARLRTARAHASIVARVAALALACAACGGDDATLGVAPRTLSAAARAERTERVVARVHPEDYDLAVGAGRVRDGMWCPRVGAPDRVAVRGDFDLSSANLLRIPARDLGGAHLRVGLRLNGRTLCVEELDADALAGGVLRIDLRACGDAGADRADELVIGVSRHDEGAALGTVELVHRPSAAIVPRPGDGAEAFLVGEETREAYGVTPRAPLAARLMAPGEGSTARTVRFAVANTGGEVAALRCTTRARGADDVVVELEVPAGSAWTPVRVPVAAGADRVDVAVAVARGALAVTEPRCVRAARRPPAVLLVTSDTHRGDHLGFLGAVDVDTPHLDALAARGTAFTDARSVAHITNPSHVSVMTGVHVNDHGITDNSTPLAARAGTLAEAFRDAGWRTIAVTSVRHLAPEHAGLAQGFDAYVAPASMGYEGFDASERLTRLLDEQDGEPVFAWLHLFDAHSPYRPPERWRTRYQDPDRDPYDRALPPPARRVPWDLELRDLEVLPAWYRGEVSALDERLGAVLAHSRVRDAWVAFTSDHGERLDAGLGVIEHETLVRDTLYVPLVIAGPGVPAGAERAAPVSNQDLGRTLLDLAGLDRVAFPGRDLFTIEDDDASRFAFARYGRSVCVERGGLLYVRHLADHVGESAPIDYRAGDEELFDLSRDPACRRNVIAGRPERAADLRARVDRFLAGSRELEWGAPRELSDAERAELEALGYAGG